MFLTTFGCSLNFAFVCIGKVMTPVGLVPIPLVNISFTCASIPNIFNIFIGGLPSQNLLTVTPFSNGSEVSAPFGGLISQMFCSSTRNLLGSFKVFHSCAPVNRFLDPTLQNGFIPNSYGMTLTPFYVKQMVMI